MDKNEAQKILDNQKKYFNAGNTLAVKDRKAALKRLKSAIDEYEEKLCEALKEDLGKSSFETYETEIGIVQAEISHTLRHLKKWAKPKRVPTPLAHFPSSSYTRTFARGSSSRTRSRFPFQ